MKYKILKGTELFNQLTDLNKRMKKVKKTATDLAASFGGGKVATTGNHLAGGIDAIEFKEKPDGWRSVGNSWQGLYYPKAVNKAILKQIADLPVVKIDELNDIVGFRGRQTKCSGGGIAWIKSVGMQWHKDFILMETAEGTEYTPLPDVIEILGSEYDELSKRIKD
jgi:hypothetical protein